jgi:hypothetical protein
MSSIVTRSRFSGRTRLATAEDVQSFVRGHVRWPDGTPGPAIELKDIDWTTVDWHVVLKVMQAVL